MTCEAVRDLLSLYIDGELDADTTSKIEAHLRSCVDCTLELEALKRTVELCGSLEELEVPDGFRTSLMAKVSAARSGAFSPSVEPQREKSSRVSGGLLRRLFGSGPKQALAVAAAALVVIVGANSAMGTLNLPFGGRTKSTMPSLAQSPGTRSSNVSGPMITGAMDESVKSRAAAMPPSPAAAPVVPESKGGFTAAGSAYDMAQAVERQIIRRGNLQIETGKERFDEVSRQVILQVEAFGGFIQDSSVFTEADGKRIANFSIRIPEAQFSKVMTQFESYGRVVNRSIGSQDVTEQSIDMEAQLSNRERQQTRLLELLGKAKTLDEILRIESELNRIRTEIDSYKSRLKYLKNAVTMSSLHVTLRESAEKISPQPPSLWRDAWQAFLRSIRSMVIFLGEIVPFLVAGWFIWFLVMTYKKK